MNNKENSSIAKLEIRMNSSKKENLENLSNFRHGSICSSSSTYKSLPFKWTCCFSLLLVISSSQVGNCENGAANSANSISNVPDQLAMAAEHRIGIHGPQGVYGPAPTGFHSGGPGHGHPPQGLEEAWPLQSQHDMPQIKILQVQCEKSHMRVNIEFDRPFYGMIFSKGHYSDPHCVHLVPGSGHLSATFDIYLNACGMTSSANNNGVYGPAPSGTFVENTIIIQYDPLVQEVWDQARKLRCTWYDFYEKSVTFRPFQVDMLHAVTANFLGDNLQCWMQIQVGKGPWASEVSGIVKIGQTMTMVLAIKDDENKFDMLVRNCVAHDGKRAPIQLVDQYGCVTRPKIMSRFHKIKNFGASASVVSYAYFQAFKFPDSMNVHFQCVIQVCRYQCPEPKCGGEDAYGPPGLGHGGIPDPRIPHGAYSENKETITGGGPSHPHSGEHDQTPSQSSPQAQQVPPPSAPQQPHSQPQVNMVPAGMSPPPPPQGHPPLPQHMGPPPPGFPKPMLVPMPMPAKPSHVMLPPGPPHHSGYANVKREGVVVDDGEDDDEEDEEGQSFAALGGRPRSVDFEKAEKLRMVQQQKERTRRDISLAEDDADSHTFVVRMSHVYKRAAQEMTDVETTRVIQVVAPGDVAFNLGGASNSTADSVVIESTQRSDIDGICMSVSSFVGGLVMLLLLLVVASLVAAFLFVRVRSIHRKTAVFGGGYDNPEYMKHQTASS